MAAVRAEGRTFPIWEMWQCVSSLGSVLNGCTGVFESSWDCRGHWGLVLGISCFLAVCHTCCSAAIWASTLVFSDPPPQNSYIDIVLRQWLGTPQMRRPTAL